MGFLKVEVRTSRTVDLQEQGFTALVLTVKKMCFCMWDKMHKHVRVQGFGLLLESLNTVYEMVK